MTLGTALTWAQGPIIVYFLAINVVYLVLFAVSLGTIVKHLHRMSYRDPREVLKSQLTPPISILVPAHNESATIISSVKAISYLNYPQYEIIVINDGSVDGTLEKLIAAFHLRKTKRVYHQTIPTRDVRGIYASVNGPAPWLRLIVVDKEKGGKADALNAGINVSHYPLFCSVDADSILEQDALLRVVMPFLERSSTMGVGGIVRIANGCRISHGVVEKIGLPRRWLPRFQSVEYLRAFLSGRLAWSRMNGLLVISGAFSLFKKAPVIEAGGYDTTTVGEDMELVVRLHHDARRRGLKNQTVQFVPDPVCWTEAPEKIRMLWRQRNRWQRGLGQALRRHSPMLFNPRFGFLAFAALPYFLFVEFLSPVVETFGYLVFFLAIATGTVRWNAFAAFTILSILMGINLSLFAVLLEEFTLQRYPKARDLLRLFAAAILENLGYRQLLNLARLDGMVDWLRQKNMWGILERKGLENHA